MKSHFLVVLETNSESSEEKTETMRRCTQSLIDSINYATEQVPNFSFELAILDDHSDQDALNILENLMLTARFSINLSHLPQNDSEKSLLSCFEYGKKHGSDWVYFIKDRYLHKTHAIAEMLKFAVDSTKKIGNFASVFPYDDPSDYDENIISNFTYLSKHEDFYWRTLTKNVTQLLIHHQVILRNWDLFHDTCCTDNISVGKLFAERGYFLFSPLDSLAIQMR